MIDMGRRYPNLEDRYKLEKLTGTAGPIPSLARRAGIESKHAAIELKAMAYRGQALKVPTDHRGHYIWRLV